MAENNKRRKRKIPTVWESGIPIRIRATGKKRYYSDIYHRGVRERVFHESEEAARKYCIKKAGEVGDEGARAIALTSDQRVDAMRAIKILAGSTSLEAAAGFYVKHTATGERGKPAREIIDDLLAGKKAANRRPTTLRDAEHRLRVFAQTFGDRPLGTVTLHELERWLAGLEVGPVTRLNYRTAVVGLFRYAMRRGLTDANPAEGLPRPARDESMPEIFTPSEAKAILNTAAKMEPAFVPYFAVGLFAGLRPENELRLLDWRHIDLKARTIRVVPASAKKRRMRFVKIAPNLRDWLAPYAQSEGRIYYSRRRFREIVLAAGVSWRPDIMRHSFGSYHLAANGDAAATALELGHAGAPGVLFDHYRALATAKDARAFWKIRPPSTQIVAFPAKKTA